jgi:tRNA dimethylallyltransferase
MTLFLPSLVGATGSGKTKLSLLVAQHVELEIVNADSRQIYRGFDLGTAKPTAAEQSIAPHHLLDAADPEEIYSAARFGVEARRIAQEIHARGRIPLLVGGSGLYLRAAEEGLFEGPAASPSIRERLHARALLEGSASLHRELERVDPRSAARLAPRDVIRLVRALEVHELTGIPLSEHHARHRRSTRVRALRFGIDWEPAGLNQRIETRIEAMLSGGWIEEVESLLARGIPEDAPAWNALGYAQVRDLVRGRSSREETRASITMATRQYAKRQRTWFRAVQPIRWHRVASEEELPALAVEIAGRLREKHAP